jgi:hypothetical protein
METWEFLIENGCVVVRPDVPRLFCLNTTARVIWNAYRQTHSEFATADILAEVFAISRDLANHDVRAMLDNWSTSGLLVPSQGAQPPQWNGHHGEARAVAYCAIEGTTFLLLTDSPAFISELAPRLDGIHLKTCQPDVTIAVWACADDLFAVVVGDECVAIEQGVQAARALVLQELVARARPGREWLALLHAGACGIGNRCVLFPASSRSGKSTLVAALMANGLIPYSDDFLGVTVGTFQIPAMPFPIAVRQGSWDVLKSWLPEIEDRSPISMCGEQFKFLPVAQPPNLVAGDAVGIAFCEWAPGAALSEWRMTTADVIGRLDTSGFWVRHDRTSIGAFLAWLERIPKLVLKYGDLTDAVGRVRTLLR